MRIPAGKWTKNADFGGNISLESEVETESRRSFEYEVDF